MICRCLGRTSAEDGDRPPLQRLRQQRVIGVGERPAGDAPRVGPRQDVLVDQQPHELGDGDRGMRIVQLHRELLMELLDGKVLPPQDAEHVLKGAGDEEELLLQAQFLAAQLVIVRVENLAEVLRGDLLVHRAVVVAAVEDGEIEGLGRFRPPQPQGVRRVGAITEDERVVRHAVDDLVGHPAHAQPIVLVDVLLGGAAELDLDRPLRARQLPGIAESQPLVGLLDLPAVDDFLVEDPEFVADAVAHARHFERRQRIDEAGGEPAEAAVPEARLLLLGEQAVEIEAELRDAFLDGVEDPEIDEIVSKVRTHQELGGQIRHGTRGVLRVYGGGADPALQHPIAYGICERHVIVVLGGEGGELALHVEEIVQERTLDRVFAECSPLVLDATVGLHGFQSRTH